MTRVLVLLAALASVARAEPPGAVAPVAPPPAPPPGYQWQLAPVAPLAAPRPAAEPRYYRGTMVLVDAAAAAAVIGGLAWPRPSPSVWQGAPGMIAFAAFGPLIHAVHGDRVGAGESLALRVGLPALGALLAYGAFRCQGSTCYDGNNDTAYEVLGAIAGVGVAAIIDDGWLAHERPEQPAWSPVIVPTASGGATAGVAGRF